jgi:putative flippase GtrA
MVIGRFLAVGSACALLHNVIMIAGDFVGWHYAASSVVSLVVVTAFGYLLHSRWTFADAQLGWASFTRYAVAVSANFPLSLAGLFVFVDLLGIPVLVAAPVTTVILLAFNYVANRWALSVRRGGS